MAKLNSTILAIARCSSQFRSERMAEYGLKGCHISYLLNICSHPGISQDQLAQMIYFNKSNVARQAAALEEAGYITRTPSASDRRVLELYPTEKARQLLPHIRQILQDWNKIMTAELSDEDTDTIRRVLEKMQENAGNWMNTH